jgi:hypothetical protein
MIHVAAREEGKYNFIMGNQMPSYKFQVLLLRKMRPESKGAIAVNVKGARQKPLVNTTFWKWVGIS